jgi:uncharacterized membrane protein YadS
MVTKLLRVVFLAPVVAILPSIMRRSVGDGAQSRSENPLQSLRCFHGMSQAFWPRV